MLGLRMMIHAINFPYLAKISKGALGNRTLESQCFSQPLSCFQLAILLVYRHATAVSYSLCSSNTSLFPCTALILTSKQNGTCVFAVAADFIPEPCSSREYYNSLQSFKEVGWIGMLTHQLAPSL